MISFWKVISEQHKEEIIKQINQKLEELPSLLKKNNECLEELIDMQLIDLERQILEYYNETVLAPNLSKYGIRFGPNIMGFRRHSKKHAITFIRDVADLSDLYYKYLKRKNLIHDKLFWFLRVQEQRKFMAYEMKVHLVWNKL
jgi:hypothetical protein